MCLLTCYSPVNWASGCAEVAEWLKVLVSKTSDGNPIHEFESHPLREPFFLKNETLGKENRT